MVDRCHEHTHCMPGVRRHHELKSQHFTHSSTIIPNHSKALDLEQVKGFLQDLIVKSIKVWRLGECEFLDIREYLYSGGHKSDRCRSVSMPCNSLGMQQGKTLHHHRCAAHYRFVSFKQTAAARLRVITFRHSPQIPVSEAGRGVACRIVKCVCTESSYT